MTSEMGLPEETLDPSDWGELRALGHRMVDDMFAYLETVRERPVWQPIPDDVAGSFRAPLPQGEQPAETVYEEFQRNILPYPLGNIHPRFWGWVMGNGTPLAMLSEMLAAGMNPNMGGGDHVANRVEMQVIEWLKEMLGYSAEASGLLVSGGSMANLLGLAVARNHRCGFDVRNEGVGASPQPMTMYGSSEMHSSLQRASEVLGLGNSALRRIPVRDDYKIDVAALLRAIKEDVEAGYKPICLIGNAGTVNTGAMDPLSELADIAEEHGMWFHVDGAFGALAYLSPDLRHMVQGLERADSVAFDLHKWLYLPFEAGCVLVHDREAHKRTFALVPDYLKHGDRGTASGPMWFSEYGLQLTRGFRALKVWMALKTYGAQKMGRLIRQNVMQAAYLGRLVEESPQLELLAPIELNVVCFRFVLPGLDDAKLNALNEELLIRLQEAGLAVPSGTLLRGRYAIRCAITNHRSRQEDFDALVADVVRIGEDLVAEEWGADRI
ncbi:MAG TPA: aminotransferase class I/II-fold pyridoxal phosphate-dependent enzyme [Chloroflexia bacterium]|nr:aminotransferase class I/II-fold pyridoxal phosphate-dependent enzyme [Chloroflexia bacterium]